MVPEGASASSVRATNNAETKISDRLSKQKLDASLATSLGVVKSPDDSMEFMSEAYPILRKKPELALPKLDPTAERTGHTLASFKKAIRVEAYKAGLRVSFAPVLMNMDTLEQIIECTLRPLTWRDKSRRLANVHFFFRAVSVALCIEPEALGNDEQDYDRSSRIRTEVEITLASDMPRHTDPHVGQLLVIPLVKKLTDALDSSVTTKHIIVDHPQHGTSVESIIGRIVTRTSTVREERGIELLIAKLVAAFDAIGPGPKQYA